MSCPCGTDKEFSQCCEPFITGKALPQTAEELMRSRYTAYTIQNIDYIKQTLAPESQEDFDLQASKDWAQNAKWMGLKILKTKKGTSEDKTGTVEFVATYNDGKDTLEHHEVSEFRKNKGRWFFVDGHAHTHKEGESHQHHHTQETVIRDSPKVGRNDPCPCGSGKKYKKCCAA